MASDLLSKSVASAAAPARREMTQLQKDIVQTLLDDREATADQIAEKLGCHKTAVYKTLQKQHVREHILMSANADLLMSVREAMDTQRSLLKSKSDYIKHQAATDLLNRNEIGSSGVIIGQAVQVKIDLS